MRKEDVTERFSHDTPSSSVVFHVARNLMFNKERFAHKIVSVETDGNLDLNNPERLKEKLFRHIAKRYNSRIEKYALTLAPLLNTRKDDLLLKKYKFVSGEEEEGGLEKTGKHMIYPRTFVCDKCGDLRIVSKDEWSSFDPNHCRRDNCDGSYEQVSLLMFCETCGNIRPLDMYYCDKHGQNHLKLIWKDKDSLATWKVVCRECSDNGKKEPIDIFRFSCDHKINGTKISSDKPSKFKPLTIKEGGIYTPVVINSIDIPKMEEIDLPVSDRDFLLLSLYLGRFKPDDFYGDEVDLDTLIEDYQTYNQKQKKARFIKKKEETGISREESEILWKIENHVDKIEEVVGVTKAEYAGVDVEALNDYFSMAGTYSGTSNSITYADYIETIGDQTLKEMKKRNYDCIKNELGIGEIMYLPDIKLISANIGLISGVNKFYEEGFVPHFNPNWDKKKEKMTSYIHTFETEGLLISLNPVNVCKWLERNELIGELGQFFGRNEAIALLLKLKDGTNAYKAVKTLIHTLSHSLLNNLSVYTGLDSDSCSEMLFVNHASFLLYSTSSINIGGFKYVFNHSIQDWFTDMKLSMRECNFDPSCISEKGACFSCMYLPEYVCSEFNQLLDRDVFIGEHRFRASYWG